MRQSAGFSKYAVAFSDNTGDVVGRGIEGPEELVQFLVKNKQKRSHPQKTNQARSPQTTTSTTKPKPSSRQDRKYNDDERRGGAADANKSARSKRTNKPASPQQPKPNLDSPNHTMAYEHHKGARPANSRDKNRGNNRGARQNKNAEMFDPKHRVFDRHSGMAKTSVKPSPRTHGRDDFDIKGTLENEINIDKTGHVKVNELGVAEDNGEVAAAAAAPQDTRPRPRGGPRQPRGANGGGRDRHNKNTGENRSFKPRGGRTQQPTTSSNNPPQPSSTPASMQSGYLLDEKDFPSFDA